MDEIAQEASFGNIYVRGYDAWQEYCSQCVVIHQAFIERFIAILHFPISTLRTSWGDLPCTLNLAEKVSMQSLQR